MRHKQLMSRGETNRSNIRIKVFVHRCSNFVSLFELFVPLAHAQNNPRSKKKPVLAMDESAASSSSVRKHFEKNKGAGTVTYRIMYELAVCSDGMTEAQPRSFRQNRPASEYISDIMHTPLPTGAALLRTRAPESEKNVV